MVVIPAIAVLICLVVGLCWLAYWVLAAVALCLLALLERPGLLLGLLALILLVWGLGLVL